MLESLKFEQLISDKAGVVRNSGSIDFVFDLGNYFGRCKEAGLILYDKNLNECKIPFDLESGIGSLVGLRIFIDNFESYSYNFYVDDAIINDPMGRAFTSKRRFGEVISDAQRQMLIFDEFDWEGDSQLHIPYNESLFYGLNVRSFTMSKTSKVKNKGTFEGIVEKIPYFTELGVKNIVLMPSYEFDETLNIKKKVPKNVDEQLKSALDESLNKVNCWGFQKGYYYAPKALYSKDINPCRSFKNMVKQLHKNGIEVLMQFYFENDISPESITDILKFWTYEYHVDGFRISGFNIPFRAILMCSALKKSKLWFDYLPTDDVENAKNPYIKNVSVLNGNYRYDLRKLLKGDEGMVNPFLYYQKTNPEDVANINMICDYDGFTLFDLFTYERKHNEENGENNSDGQNINYSWNCGTEGPTKKKQINALRLKQIKNALSLLLLSAGTPYIFAGDEFGNSRYGNNNAYCLDNEKGYVEWKDNAFSNDILNFTKTLIALRNDNSIFHPEKELTNMDVLSNGYPDLSYHGFEAYRPDLTYNSRTVGMLFYAPQLSASKISYYLGINMYWGDQSVAIPNLKKNTVCKVLINTESDDAGTDEIINDKDNRLKMTPRTVTLLKIENQKV